MKWWILLIILGIAHVSPAQDVETVHGLGISIAFPKKLRINVSYNLHIRSHIEVVDKLALTPMADFKLSLFHRHMGASLLRKYEAPLYTNLTVSYGGLVSYNPRPLGEEGWVPVFTSIYQNTFNTSYKYNFGFASSQMLQFALSGNATIKDKMLHQQLGNVMIGVDDFYMTYYNDGGPVLNLFGDGEDRYWTGGLVLGYLYRDVEDIHRFEASFDKFTGFTEDAFEATGLLHVDNVIYKDVEQFSYNTGRLSLKYHNYGLGAGGSVNVWNLPFDLQDYLHRDVSNNPYHHKIENAFIDVEFYKTYRL